jgi:hypothetical protein
MGKKSKKKKNAPKKGVAKNILSTKVDRHQQKQKKTESNNKSRTKSVPEDSNNTDLDEILDKFDSGSDGFENSSFENFSKSGDDEDEDVNIAGLPDSDNEKKDKPEFKVNKPKKALATNIKANNIKANNTKANNPKFQNQEIKEYNNSNNNSNNNNNNNKQPIEHIEKHNPIIDDIFSGNFPTLAKFGELPKLKSTKNVPSVEKAKITNRIIRAENINALSRWDNVPNKNKPVKFDKLVGIKDPEYGQKCLDIQRNVAVKYVLQHGRDDPTLEFTDRMKPKKKMIKNSGDSLADILRNPKMALALGDQFYCYSDRNNRRLFLDRPLVTDKTVQLYVLKREITESSTNNKIDKDDNHRLIVKNYNSDSKDRDIKYEIGAYQSIRSLLLESGYETNRNLLIESYIETYGAEPTDQVLNDIDIVSKNRAQKLVYRVLPYFSSSYMMYGQPVLILELLEKLDQTDDPYNIGFEIIHHLYYIHQIGVHTDIKPENIMKIARMSDGKKKMFYYLIDFGGMTCDRFPGGGYRRFVWSPKWTSQIKPNWYKELGMEGKETEKVRQTCPRFDFIELGITMRVFQITSKLPTVPSDIDERYLHDYTKYKGRLKKYMEYVLSLPNSETYPQEVYRKLQDILSPIEIVE